MPSRRTGTNQGKRRRLYEDSTVDEGSIPKTPGECDFGECGEPTNGAPKNEQGVSVRAFGFGMDSEREIINNRSRPECQLYQIGCKKAKLERYEGT